MTKIVNGVVVSSDRPLLGGIDHGSTASSDDTSSSTSSSTSSTVEICGKKVPKYAAVAVAGAIFLAFIIGIKGLLLGLAIYFLGSRVLNRLDNSSSSSSSGSRNIMGNNNGMNRMNIKSMSDLPKSPAPAGC